MIKIVYFSGTGNTKFIAGRIGEFLKEKEQDFEMISIELSGRISLGAQDAVYIGFPVYGFRMPPIVRDFIKGLEPGEGRKAKVFCTMAYGSGGALLDAAALLGSKGYEVQEGYKRQMPGSDGLAFLKKDGKAARTLVSNFNSDFSDLRNWVYRDKPLVRLKKTGLGSLLAHALMNGAEKFLAKKLRADENCIKCGLCVRKCPVGNIAMDDRGICFDRKCILCMRCIHQCPAEAIQFGKMTVGKFRYKGPEKLIGRNS